VCRGFESLPRYQVPNSKHHEPTFAVRNWFSDSCRGDSVSRRIAAFATFAAAPIAHLHIRIARTELDGFRFHQAHATMEQNCSRRLSCRCRADADRDARRLIVRTGEQRLDLDRQGDDDGSVLAARARDQGAAYHRVLLLSLRRKSVTRTRDLRRDTVLGSRTVEAVHHADEREHDQAEIESDRHQIRKI